MKNYENQFADIGHRASRRTRHNHTQHRGQCDGDRSNAVAHRPARPREGDTGAASGCSHAGAVGSEGTRGCTQRSDHSPR